jgi:hypothetical protein
MKTTGPTGNGPEFGDSSWTDETLPMSLRKELLDRELQKYSAAKHANASSHQHSKPQGDRDNGSSSHPSAGGSTDEGGHAD